MTKIKKAAVVCVTAVTIFCTSSVLTKAATIDYAIIREESVNLRSEPNTDSNVIKRYNAGDKLVIVEKSNGWTKVVANESTGWVRDDMYIRWQVEYLSVTGDSVNIRKGPSIDSDVVFHLRKGDDAEILDMSGEWYYISYDGQKGWVRRDLTTMPAGSKYKVIPEGLNLRETASTDAPILDVLDQNQRIMVMEIKEEWCRVRSFNNKFGWVKLEFLQLSDNGPETEATVLAISSERTFATQSISRGSTSSSSSNTSNSSTRKSPSELAKENAQVKKEATASSLSSSGVELSSQLVEYAKTLLGVKYVYGGNSTKGFDCSGFTKYVYNNFSISIQRVAADQAKQGSKVLKSELAPGDLVFFDTDGRGSYINHVGIYVGGGNFIHASSGSNRKVVISDITSGFYNNCYMTARRILK